MAAGGAGVATAEGVAAAEGTGVVVAVAVAAVVGVAGMVVEVAETIGAKGKVDTRVALAAVDWQPADSSARARRINFLRMGFMVTPIRGLGK